MQEVPSSNLGGPTKTFKDLETPGLLDLTVWSPTGVQKWTPAPGEASWLQLVLAPEAGPDAGHLLEPPDRGQISFLISWLLSPSAET